MFYKKQLLSFIYLLCSVLSKKKKRVLNKIQGSREVDISCDDDNTAHIVYCNVFAYLIEHAIYYEPRLEAFFEYSRNFLNKSHEESNIIAVLNIRYSIEKVTKNHYSEHALYKSYYLERLRMSKNDILWLYLELVHLTHRDRNEWSKSKKFLEDSLKDCLVKYPIDVALGGKILSRTPINPKRKMNKINEIIKAISENKELEKFIFVQFAIFFVSFFSQVNNGVLGFSPLSRILGSSELSEARKENIKSEVYFKSIRNIYYAKNWNYPQNLFENNYKDIDECEMNAIIRNGLFGFQKSLFRGFKIPFDLCNQSMMSIYSSYYSRLVLNNDFLNCIFPGFNIFFSETEMPSFDFLNMSRRINMTVILQSEPSLVVFLGYFIKKVDEKYFYKIFVAKDTSEKKSQLRKLIDGVFKAIKKIEPLYKEISIGLYNKLINISVDVHITFVLYKLDSKLFQFLENELLKNIKSENLKQKVKNEIFGNSEIFNVFFDLYKTCFLESTDTLKTLKHVKEVEFKDLPNE
ncbi:hypothetical protein CWI36_0076p0020 [Hamiltosporidium magnivora]|uniref:Uncharacterized protein n=1 Tax=Hamiltosporidium magnivora TaxID=148818 RepID=A0A4Q9LNC9_9MICR|nr:hypothetical protein CWI36_0076p0020 [Hamiltosporidium magnivora]